MNLPLVIIIGSQLLFTSGDLLARHYMPQQGFKLATFLSWWFLAYMTVRTVATFGQLFIFTQMELGRTMALFGASGLILANVLGLLILKEQLPLSVYFGGLLAVIAFLVVGLSKA